MKANPGTIARMVRKRSLASPKKMPAMMKANAAAPKSHFAASWGLSHEDAGTVAAASSSVFVSFTPNPFC